MNWVEGSKRFIVDFSFILEWQCFESYQFPIMKTLYWSTLNDMPTEYQFLPSDIYLWIVVIWFHQIKNVRKKIFLSLKFTLTSKDSFVNRNHWRMALHEEAFETVISIMHSINVFSASLIKLLWYQINNSLDKYACFPSIHDQILNYYILKNGKSIHSL